MNSYVGSRAGIEHAPWIDDFWAVDGKGGETRILPDGCIDFIFDLQCATAVVVGPMSRAEMVEIAPSDRLFGVRFAPGRGGGFVDAALHEIEDRTVPLADLTAAARFRLAERVAEAKTHAEREHIIVQYLVEPRARRHADDARLTHAVTLLGDGAPTVSRVARSIGVSDRTLERLFRDHVGVSPKLYARIMRMQSARRRARLRSGSQAALAAQCGYADEAHLVREFRDLTGLTARALLAEEIARDALHHGAAVEPSSPRPHDVGFVQVPASFST